MIDYQCVCLLSLGITVFLKWSGLRARTLEIAAVGCVTAQWWASNQLPYFVDRSFSAELAGLLTGALLGGGVLFVTTSLTHGLPKATVKELGGAILRPVLPSVYLVVTASAEEIIWRGAVMCTTTTCLRKASVPLVPSSVLAATGILVVNGMFVGLHSGVTKARLWQVFELYLFFLVVSASVYFSHSLIVGIGMHVTRNYIITALKEVRPSG